MITLDWAIEHGLTKKDYKKIERWYLKNNFHKRNNGAIGGEMTFEVTPTSIGDIVVVKVGDKSLPLLVP